MLKGSCEKIGFDKSIITQKNFISGEKISKEFENIQNHEKAFSVITSLLVDARYGAIKNINEISSVGHRVVHGGAYFKESSVVDDYTIEKIKDLIKLAPLHNEANLHGILACREILGKDIPQVAVFDTCFYRNLPPKAYMYAIPYEYYEKYHIRKYGFHGTSHKYINEKCSEIMNKDVKDLKLISCHLGNGSSVTAIDGGKPVDTTMGFTPLDGFMMGTRCGSIDPAIVAYLSEKESLSAFQVNQILNEKSGLLGISGISSDDRAIMKSADEGSERAILTHDMLTYQITKYIGSYIAVLGGCDAIVFTGGIGENQWKHRKNICKYLSFMGIKIDEKLNEETILGKQNKISLNSSEIDVYVIPANEELGILKETIRCLDL
jgi:acetate kinase